MAKIYWAGDSTVQTNDITTYPQTGIGQVFSLYLKEGVCVSNHAKNGRSTKSFMDEGRLQVIDEQIQEGDFMFIQFGHNDEKIEDPTRYTSPYGTFKENLKFYIHIAKNHGAYPVLITPLERRCFGDEEVLSAGAHGDYVAGMKEVSVEESVPLVDLYTMSRAMMNAAGKSETEDWFMNIKPGMYENYPDGQTDNTHLKYAGAVGFAGLIAKGLKELGGRYADLLL